MDPISCLLTVVGAFSVIVKTDGLFYSTTYLSVPGEHAEPPGDVHAARLRGLGEGSHQQLPCVLCTVVQRRHHQLQVQLVPQPGHSCQQNTAEEHPFWQQCALLEKLAAASKTEGGLIGAFAIYCENFAKFC